jgi:hypothetical protein
MNELPREGLDARVKTFLNESTALVKGSDVYKKALLMRTGSVLRIGSIMKGSVKLLYDGYYAALAPLADGSYAIVTMGTLEMVTEGRMSRIICPGAAIRNRGDRYDNKDYIKFDPYLLVSFTRSIVFNTNAHANSTVLMIPTELGRLWLMVSIGCFVVCTRIGSAINPVMNINFAVSWSDIIYGYLNKETYNNISTISFTQPHVVSELSRWSTSTWSCAPRRHRQTWLKHA